MLKLTVALLAVAVTGAASAGGWRSLRVDGSSEASFTASVATFQRKLPASRRHAFERALQDIWILGTKNAEENGRDYTASEYFRQVDGLGYEEVVTFTDPTGATAQQYRAEYELLNRLPASTFAQASPWPTPPRPAGVRGRSNSGDVSAQQACGCAIPPGY